jgi:AcrR family transcriptional regulator
VNARERILDAAVARIASEGIDDVRIARIATDAGVSAALVHYHFESRDALLAEALEHSYERAGDVRIGAPGGEPEGARERLEAMIDQCLPAPGALRDDFILWVELWLRAARRPELRATSARLYERMHEWFRAVLAELGAADPAATADRVLALCDGYGIRVLCEDPAMPRERARAALVAAAAAEVGAP